MTKSNTTVTRKIELAKMPGTRVQFARTPDAHAALDMLNHIDRSIQYIRGRMYVSFKPEDTTHLFNEWGELLNGMDRLARALDDFLGWKNYKTPSLVRKVSK